MCLCHDTLALINIFGEPRSGTKRCYRYICISLQSFWRTQFTVVFHPVCLVSFSGLPPPPPIPTPPSSSRFLRVGGGRGSSRHLWHDAWSTVRRLGQDWLPSKWQTVGCKLQVLVYDIIPSTTAVFSYAVGPRKLSANEQFFCWRSNSSKFVTNNSDYIRRLFCNRPCCLRQLK